MPILHDVRQVVECGNQVDANQYLDLGWKLLKTFSSNVAARYVLGWTSQEAPRYPKQLAAQGALNYIDAEIAKEKAKLGEAEAAK